MKRLAGKVALITGGGDGIGRAAALVFAREGAKVVIADISAALGRETAEAVGENAFFVETDVTREESVRAAVEAAAGRFGKLDTLFNCAGGSLPGDKPVTELDLAVFEHTIGLDLKGTMLACKHAIPRIIAAGGGAVINMSSGAALRGASPAQALVRNVGTCASMPREISKWWTHEEPSTDARHRGGRARSSDAAR